MQSCLRIHLWNKALNHDLIFKNRMLEVGSSLVEVKDALVIERLVRDRAQIQELDKKLQGLWTDPFRKLQPLSRKVINSSFFLFLYFQPLILVDDVLKEC